MRGTAYFTLRNFSRILFPEKMKRRTVADSVANVGESGDQDRCLVTSVALIHAPSYLADAGPRVSTMIIINYADSAGLEIVYGKNYVM